MNRELARHVFDQLRRAGVAHMCICPGGRNAPFVELLAAPDAPFESTWHFEERAAAFYALGMAKATGRPTAVCTTSGTAAGELLPAAMEAFYSGIPLVLLTADRPRRFRGSGAPQAAEQQSLFGPYASASFDLAEAERLDWNDFQIAAPVHVNVCFEEPGGEPDSPVPTADQLPDSDPHATLGGFLRAVRHPLVVVGALTAAERPTVARFLLAMGAPTYIEAPSGLRESPTLASFRLELGDRVAARAEAAGYSIDGVLRIGGVPTHRLWRDLEERLADVPVVSVSRLPFSGLGRASKLCQGDATALLSGITAPTGRWPSERLLEQDRADCDSLQKQLRAEPNSEPALLAALSERFDVGSAVYLGNSLPIREWDLAATRADRGYEVDASRGLNGIDGQISTFLGQCRPGVPNWGIFGDLTTLYDLAAPWVCGQLAAGIRAKIVILNNSGGRIFSRMFAEPRFQNSHRFTFEHWAAQWGLDYRRCESADGLECAAAGVGVVELHPDAASTDRFWARYAECLA